MEHAGPGAVALAMHQVTRNAHEQSEVLEQRLRLERLTQRPH